MSETLVAFLLSTSQAYRGEPAIAYLACENAKLVKGISFRTMKAIVNIQAAIRLESGCTREQLMTYAMNATWREQGE